MKFANIIFDQSGRLTIGDNIQLLAVQNLYEYMGIEYADVVRINYYDLASYNGEYVILPISFPLFGYHYDVNITQFSPRIIPVFLGVSFLSSDFSKADLNYLRMHAPIGCRDEYTLNNLRRNNVPAYLGGCLTATFPQRTNEQSSKSKKIFCIDVEESFKKFIPKSLLDQCEFVSHTYYATELKEDPEILARRVYDRYINEAKLIITTRLHGALPGIAAGIPVIFYKDKFSFRFAGIDKLIHVYTKEEYGNIDWNPAPIEYEETKQDILSMCAQRIWDIYNKYNRMCDISSFYETRIDKKELYVDFISNTIQFITENWSKTKVIKYALWGVTQTAHTIHSYIVKHYPNADLVAVIDKKKKTHFCGLETCNVNWLYDNSDVFIFVCTGAAIKDSYELFKKLDIKQYYQCCEDGNKHKLEYI